MVPEARVALIGAGSIAGAYLDSLQATPGFTLVAIASRDGASAARLAAANGLRASGVADALAARDIDYVLNLTPADEHVAITRASLQAGKSVYSEKPLARDLAEADALIALAKRQGVLLACAPATFLWPPLTTVRRLVQEGSLGVVSGALATLVYPGPEIFHPNPGHLYAVGPLFDMGVYQVTALIDLLGPVVAVSAMASRRSTERRILVGARAGEPFDVVAPTSIHAQLRHAGGAISTLIVSFDGVSALPPTLTLWGDKAGVTLDPHAPDAVLTISEAIGTRRSLALDGPAWTPARWAIGASSAWRSFHTGDAVAASAERARHVLAVLLAIECASEKGRTIAPDESATQFRSGAGDRSC
jgi:predicted dehydrogenase